MVSGCFLLIADKGEVTCSLPQGVTGSNDLGNCFFFFNKEEVDVPTMQLAWEFLELARIVFVRFVSQLFYINNCIT